MVNRIEIPPHQLSGSFPGGKIPLQEQEESSQAGQFIKNSVHQPPRRDEVISPLQTCDKLWALFLERRILLIASHLPGTQNCSRSVVDRHKWILNQIVFRDLNSLWGSMQVDLFKYIQTAPHILLLEVRSSCQSNRCFHSSVDRLQGLCQPLLLLDREMHTAHQETEGYNNSDNPSLALPPLCLDNPYPLVLSGDTTRPQGCQKVPQGSYSHHGLSTNRNHDSTWNIW